MGDRKGLTVRAATEESLLPVMPHGNLADLHGREVRHGSPGKLMVETSPPSHRRPPCKMNKEITDEAADGPALTYLLTYLGTNTQEDHVLLLREFFHVCQESHLRIKLEKFEFMKEEMEYLGFDLGSG